MKEPFEGVYTPAGFFRRLAAVLLDVTVVALLALGARTLLSELLFRTDMDSALPGEVGQFSGQVGTEGPGLIRRVRLSLHPALLGNGGGKRPGSFCWDCGSWTTPAPGSASERHFSGSSGITSAPPFPSWGSCG